MVLVRVSAAAMSARIPGRPAVDLTKTKLCLNFERGACTFGAKCKFAHGEHERVAQISRPVGNDV